MVARRTVAKYRESLSDVPAVKPTQTAGLTLTDKEDTMQLNITGHNVEITEALREFRRQNSPNLNSILSGLIRYTWC